MKTFYRFLVSMLLLFSGYHSFSQDFEGTVTLTTSDQTSPITLSVWGNKVLIREGSMKDREDTRILMDNESGSFYLMTTKSGMRKVIKYNFADNPTGEMMSPFQPAPPASVGTESGEYSLKKTSETKEMDGLKVTKWTFESPTSTGEAWIAGDIGLGYRDLVPAANLSGNSNAKEIGGLDGFIVDLTEKQKESGKAFHYHAKVEEKKVERELFEIPGNAEILDMSEIMKQIREANGDPEKLQEIMKAFE